MTPSALLVNSSSVERILHSSVCVDRGLSLLHAKRSIFRRSNSIPAANILHRAILTELCPAKILNSTVEPEHLGLCALLYNKLN